MNKEIFQVLILLSVQMLITILSIVWLHDIALSSIGGICIIITLLVLHDLYVIRSRQIAKHKNIWKQVAYLERERKMASEELFRSYDYATRDWR